MDSLVERPPARRKVLRRPPRRYFLAFTSIFVVLVMLGFSRTVFLPVMAGAYAKPWWVHVHGALFFGWTLLLITQAYLAASGRLKQHRAIGAYGAWLIPPMLVMGVVVAVVDTRHDYLAGQGDAALSFFYGELADLFMFGALAIPAMLLRAKPDIHKRLALLGSLGLLGAAVGRIPEISKGYSFMFVGLIASMLVYDLVTRKKPHAATLAAGALLLVVGFSESAIGDTSLWLRAAHALLRV